MKLNELRIDQPPSNVATNGKGTVTIMVNGERKTYTMDEYFNREHHKDYNNRVYRGDAHLGAVGD